MAGSARRIYELVYTARDPIVAAAGMANGRSPLLPEEQSWREPAPRTSLIFGISQSGRLIQTMLLRGLHVDEDGRAVFDGAFVHVAGGGKGGFDYRFAMPTRHFSVLEDHIYPTNFFPFATVSARDSATGAEGSILDRARALGAVPKLFYVNNSSEYWNRAASLIATDPDGGATCRRRRKRVSASRRRAALRRRCRGGIFANCVNTLSHYRAMRADAGVQALGPRRRRPAAERYPHRRRYALSRSPPWKSLPEFHFRLPGNLRPPRLDFGSRFETVASPSGCHAWETVRGPGAEAGSTGWIRAASRRPKFFRSAPGLASTPGRAAGFPAPPASGTARSCRLRAPRRAAGIRRSGPSLEARYVSRAAYEEKVRAAAADVVRRGFLLPQDVDALVSEAGGLYDRIMARDPADRSCRYLFDR